MRKQARRLWLGDWQRDAETVTGPDPADTVVITPDDGEDVPPPPERGRNVPRGVVAGAGIAALCALVLLVASGGDDNKPVAAQQPQAPPSQAPQLQTPQAQPQVPQGPPPQGFGGADLTGPAAAKAAEAAVAKFPGDVERVTHDSSGSGYVVHVIQPDGNEVHVLVGGDFRVQGSDAYSGPRGYAPPGTSQ